MISVVINADTRPNWLDPMTEIKDRGDGMLCGCRSIDFLTDGVENKRKFFAGHDATFTVCVDEHESFEIDELPLNVRYIMRHANRRDHRWNDRVYIHSLFEAIALQPAHEYICHFDGDVACFQREGYNFIESAIYWLENSGYRYVCQQATIPDHGMTHASTRFFICKRDTLDLDEAERLLDDRYRAKKFPGKHLPCLEHILGAMAGERVFYPPADYDNFIFWSWVRYYRGTLAKLNAMPYEQVLQYVERSGGLHGASDLIGVEL